jgi:chromosome segregation protein
VDAPLDDSNVERFNQMLRDLSRNTQFLVITHNKKSMEGADCLFGVTSEETGASTLVSVRLDKL